MPGKWTKRDRDACQWAKNGSLSNNFLPGHYEVSPYNPGDVRSAYYVREYDVKKLLQVQQPMDVFLSHDWPRGVERYGDLSELLRVKPFFRAEVSIKTRKTQKRHAS